MPTQQRILVVGARGQLGTDLCAQLGPQAVAVDLPDFDATREAQVAATLDQVRPAVVVNCAAQTNVDQCEREPEAAFAANALTALHIARQAERVEAAVIFISTDYVFGAAPPAEAPGVRSTLAQNAGAGPAARCAAAYTELDFPGPLNVYGATKLAGEHLTAAANPRHYIVRTSGLYGHAGARGKGGNFVETMLRLAGEGRPVRVVNDQRLSPTYTPALTERLLLLLRSRCYGHYHLAAPDSCTWYEFAAAIFAHAGLTVDLRPIATSEYPLPARRPPLSALQSLRLPAVGIPDCPPWRAMLAEDLDRRPH